jgi:hypothetical protein
MKQRSLTRIELPRSSCSLMLNVYSMFVYMFVCTIVYIIGCMIAYRPAALRLSAPAFSFPQAERGPLEEGPEDGHRLVLHPKMPHKMTFILPDFLSVVCSPVNLSPQQGDTEVRNGRFHMQGTRTFRSTKAIPTAWTCHECPGAWQW